MGSDNDYHQSVSRLVERKRRLHVREDTTEQALLTHTGKGTRTCHFWGRKCHTVKNCWKKNSTDNKSGNHKSRKIFKCSMAGRTSRNCRNANMKANNDNRDVSDTEILTIPSALVSMPHRWKNEYWISDSSYTTHTSTSCSRFNDFKVYEGLIHVTINETIWSSVVERSKCRLSLMERFIVWPFMMFFTFPTSWKISSLSPAYYAIISVSWSMMMAMMSMAKWWRCNMNHPVEPSWLASKRPTHSIRLFRALSLAIIGIWHRMQRSKPGPSDWGTAVRRHPKHHYRSIG